MNGRIAELQQKRRYASLLMNYSCTIACPHCCFNCSPRASDAVATVDSAVRYLGQLRQLDRLVHIAGGEPFFHYDRLRAILRAAREHGVTPHFVESNCSWCTSEALALERFHELKDNGVLWMLISTDVFHLRCNSIDRIASGLAAAEAVFGEGTTMGLCTPEQLAERAALARDETRFVEHSRHLPLMLVGRAWKGYARFAEPRPIADLTLETGWGLDPGNTCSREWDPLWEIHVDPYGNVQTNCGIIIGNANEIPVPELMRTWHLRNPFLRSFSQRGVAFLLEEAQRYGFEAEAQYPQKCYLCTALRRFLRSRDNRFKALFGPDEVYEDPPYAATL